SGVDAATATTVMSSDPANYFGDNPQIHIVKTVNGQDANAAPGVHVLLGSALNFTYTVTTPGNVPLSGISVTDNTGLIPVFQSGDTNANGLLDPGEIWVYTASSTVVSFPTRRSSDLSGVDAATATTVMSSDPANYFGDNPQIHIV